MGGVQVFFLVWMDTLWVCGVKVMGFKLIVLSLRKLVRQNSQMLQILCPASIYLGPK